MGDQVGPSHLLLEATLTTPLSWVAGMASGQMGNRTQPPVLQDSAPVLKLQSPLPVKMLLTL